MNKPFIEIDAEHITISSFKTKIIEGYEVPKNSKTGETFPYCCPFHKSVYEASQKWFDKFPNCCEPHEAMQKKVWFNKSNYEGLPGKIVSQLSFTEHHIIKQIDIIDWYKDITNYIEYNVSSFGHPAIGLHLYLANLKHFIKEKKVTEISKEKRQRLLEYIETYYNSKETPKIDFNILFSTYQKWLTVFPFEVSYFKNMKEYFETQLPILDGKLELNPYTGFSKGKMLTQSGLIEVLTNLTKQLLLKINSAETFSKGLIPDTNKHTLQLINESHRVKQLSLVGEFGNGEIEYVKLLEKWLSNEKEYFKELTPLIAKDDIKLKVKISIALIGLDEDYRKSLNNENTTSPVFHHIKGVLKQFNISPKEGREIMLDMKGTYSPKMNTNVIEPIISYLERINQEPETNTTEPLNIQNNFDSIDIKNVYSYFHKALVEKKHFSESDLNAYLIAAFDKKEKPETLFQLKNAPTKQKVINIFYLYYKDIASKPHGKQKMYAALLGEYFLGYDTQNVSTNFNK